MLAVLNAVGWMMASARMSAPRLAAGTQPVRRVLVIELWNLGDVILTLPFLAQLRALFPSATISMLARPHARTLLDGTGLVDEFIETDLGWTDDTANAYPAGYRWRELRRLRHELKRRDFDIAFKARMHVREHAIILLSGARRRVSFTFGNKDAVLTDAIPVDDPHGQKALDWLKLLEPFGGARSIAQPRLRVSEAERKWAAGYLHDRGVEARDLIVGIHPGASVVAKQWPLDRFGAIARSLGDRGNLKILWFVEPGGYGSPIGYEADVITAKVGLRELIALIDRCAVLICNDSGPMHIAGALGVPTVAIFGSGVPSWFAPLGERHQLITRGSEHGDGGAHRADYDVAEVSVARVAQAVELALGAALSRG